ncbi:MAG: bifunctional aspartate kinase/homoserine dehydrogenase I [Deltaproteobacteria bacterium]|nr:bifunctional aspartate kinase/homoserine dehydrogenase I [Deltaproteobacteria bacterium]
MARTLKPRRRRRGAAASPLWVFKFGGTSVGTDQALRLALKHVQGARARLVVVVSAMSGITDLLLHGVQAALERDPAGADAAAQSLAERHLQMAAKLLATPERLAAMQRIIDEAVAEYRAICKSVGVLRELSTRTSDAAAARGERLLAQLFAHALAERGVAATYVDAHDVISTVRRHGSLWPDTEACRKDAAAHIAPLIAARRIVIVPGFIGRGPDGEVVTLGRGGSDLSATLLGASLAADQVTLYKEVDGLMTADPKTVKDARVLPELHYREAAELAYYGAKVLHPRTMIPLIAGKIPLQVRNTFNAAFSGTRIAADVEPGAYPVKALTAIRDQALLSVEGKGMMGVPGIAGRTFSALAREGHSVTMISQASSEASICFVLPEKESDACRKVLLKEFASELEAGDVDAVSVLRHLALIAVVGIGMRGTRGIAARTFKALAENDVNIIAIAQGSSELNITLAIEETKVAATLVALHREFQLDRLRPLAEAAAGDAAVTLMGFGQIGRALARQLVAQRNYFRHDLGLELRLIAIADRSSVKVAEPAFADPEILRLAEQKERGHALGRARRLVDTRRALADKVWVLPQRRPLLVDLTAGDTAPLLQDALDHGVHLVLANKKPLAVSQRDHDALFAAARERGLKIRYEATVGAGLPVFDTLAKLKEAGDKIERVLGCLSGTLGFLLTQAEQGVPFSQGVARARALGYTEPDPKDDLSGMDVARKALILARTLGARLELADVRVEPLFPAHLAHLAPDAFVAALASIDAEFAARIQAASKRDTVLRYVARIEGDAVSVGIEAVPAASPMGRLHGTDNQIVVHSKRYHHNPLVLTGPGAGAEVTAAGVLNDIVAVAKAT